jgi:hypothetical protein
LNETIDQPKIFKNFFERVTRTPETSVPGLDTENLLVFSAGKATKLENQTKCWERNFEFLPGPRENVTGNLGQSGWEPKLGRFEFWVNLTNGTE